MCMVVVTVTTAAGGGGSGGGDGDVVEFDVAVVPKTVLANLSATEALGSSASGTPGVRTRASCGAGSGLVPRLASWPHWRRVIRAVSALIERLGNTRRELAALAPCDQGRFRSDRTPRKHPARVVSQLPPPWLTRINHGGGSCASIARAPGMSPPLSPSY
jgi:hypothetical protein